MVATSVACLLLTLACGSSSTTVVRPSSDRCDIAVAGSSSTLPADGGSGTITVSAARECVWSATSESAWLTITSGTSGQGDGTVGYQAQRNPTPTMRRGGLVINNRRTEIPQAAAPCEFRLGSAGQTVEAIGGEGSVTVETLDGCNWTATTNAGWVAIEGAQNRGGPGTVRFRVEPNTGSPRSATLTIAGLSFSIAQSGADVQCSYRIEPAARSVPAAGGAGSVAVNAPAGCAWTAASQSPWISTVGEAAGNGSGVVNLAFAPNTGATRTGTVTIASQLHTVTQAGAAAPCAYSIEPSNQSVPASGGPGTISVTAAAGCAWTAASQVPWITVTAGSSGTGTGIVSLTIAANTGAARTGTVTVADRTYSVAQAAAATPCSYSLSTTVIAAPAAGGNFTVVVSTSSSCSWTATRQAEWIAVTEGGNGTGGGRVTLTVAANGGTARSGSVVIAGQTVAVNQAAAAAPCTYNVTPPEQSVPASGGTPTFNVTTQAACAWTAASQVPWITIADDATSTGDGGVMVTVAANSGAARTGTLLIAGRTVTVNQAGVPPPCTFAIAPTELTVPTAGGATAVTVTTQQDCAWTAVSQAEWIGVASGGTGSGSGMVQLTVAANTGAARTGTVSIAGHTFTVTQEAAPATCTYGLAPTNQHATNAGGEFSVQVATGPGCGWTAVPDAPWIEILGSATGNGSGTVTYRVLPHPESGSRTSKIEIAGQRITIVQGPM